MSTAKGQGSKQALHKDVDFAEQNRKAENVKRSILRSKIAYAGVSRKKEVARSDTPRALRLQGVQGAVADCCECEPYPGGCASHTHTPGLGEPQQKRPPAPPPHNKTQSTLFKRKARSDKLLMPCI